MQCKRPTPGRHQVLERKGGLGVGGSIKNEGELSSDVRGEERLSHES